MGFSLRPEDPAMAVEQLDPVVAVPGTKRVERPEENAIAAGLRLGAQDLADPDALPAAAQPRC